MDYFSRFLDWSYYVQPLPGGDFLIGYGMLAFFLAVAFLPQIIRSVGPKNKYFKKSLKKKLWYFPVVGIIGLFFVLVRFGEVSHVSMRLWLYLITLITAGLLLRSSLLIGKEYSKRKKSVERANKK